MGYRVPKEEQHAYKMLVQRANRQIKKNLKYIEEHDIRTANTQRSLVFDYGDMANWATEKTTFSRSIKFESEKDYRQTMRHLTKFANTSAPKLEKAYRDTIIDRLQDTAIKYQIQLDEHGQVPQNIIDMLDDMTLEQLQQWFDIGDPEEDTEVQQYGSDDYAQIAGGTLQDFTDTTKTRVEWIKTAYPKRK